MINTPQATAEELEDDLDEESMMPRRPRKDQIDLDMTSMMDCVFLLLIFFLVTSAPDQDTSVELPPAHYGAGITEQSAVVITVADRQGDKPAAVYLADGSKGTPLSDDPKQQEAAIIKAVTKEFMSGEKSSVMIKAARKVRHKYVSQVAMAVGRADIEDVKIHIAVFEEED